MNNTIYLIGEIGQNHNGDVNNAKLLCDIISKETVEDVFGLKIRPFDAVKLTRRNLDHEMSTTQYESAYISKNSFGKTYGEHRRFLELSDEDHLEIYKYAKSKGLDFIETLCAPECLTLLKYFIPDKLKVASRDLTNIPLITALAETKIPIILSTGMSDKREIDAAVETICKYHNDITILHCLSEYPASPNGLNLNKILSLLENYHSFRIGYSDHTIGIAAAILAIGLGARVIEKHITLDRTQKGSDHISSLGPEGIKKFARDIRLSEIWLGSKELKVTHESLPAKKKLSRSLATKHNIKSGHKISEADLQLLSPGDGFTWSQRTDVIGHITNQDIGANEIIYPNMII